MSSTRPAPLLLALAFAFGLLVGCFEDDGGDDGGGCPGSPGCACMSNEDCNGAIICEAGICNEDECVSHSDCPAEAPVCSKGLCKACSETADACPGGTHCSAGMCIPD